MGYAVRDLDGYFCLYFSALNYLYIYIVVYLGASGRQRAEENQISLVLFSRSLWTVTFQNIIYVVTFCKFVVEQDRV
jgi:hypothetical protein